jgi:ATP-dependent Clp protease ATP-binding subunit ClpA
MKTQINVARAKKSGADDGTPVARALAARVVGQSAALRAIVPYVQMFQAGLSPEGRPVGVFLLLGPTGTGKTKTVEALAEVLHGSERNLLKVDCGEFQMEHEVAKLIGAPPGYLGHRETHPLLSQAKLNSVTSEDCGMSLVLFDEIEKAAPSLTRLLLGILDKAILRLGDNSSVNFERSLIFLTSNLGASSMMKALRPDFGFQAGVPVTPINLGSQLESIGMAAVKRKFSPEFVNRIDSVLTYRPLSREALAEILNHQIMELRRHIERRLGMDAFEVEVSTAARQHLLRIGTSPEYGARELKRTIHRHLTQPLASLVAAKRVDPGSIVFVEWESVEERIVVRTEEGVEAAAA